MHANFLGVACAVCISIPNRIRVHPRRSALSAVKSRSSRSKNRKCRGPFVINNTQKTFACFRVHSRHSRSNSRSNRPKNQGRDGPFEVNDTQKKHSRPFAVKANTCIVAFRALGGMVTIARGVWRPRRKLSSVLHRTSPRKVRPPQDRAMGNTHRGRIRRLEFEPQGQCHRK